MMTKNFRLNVLANQYATALYNHITVTNGGNYFMVDAAGLQSAPHKGSCSSGTGGTAKTAIFFIRSVFTETTTVDILNSDSKYHI